MSSRTPPERSPAVSSANQSLYEASERSCRARSRIADHAARAGGSGDSGAGRSARERVIYPQALSTVVEYKGPARGEGWGPSRSPGLADYSAGLRALAKAQPPSWRPFSRTRHAILGRAQPPSQTSRTSHETDLPAQQSQAEQDARVPRSHAHPRRPRGARPPP